eukprot:CAMPEP_0168611286 /NCGR_PEP_ID=MMETSP0449_2-20121227/2277_1 /TAXON_ID=1082188 /ORGANISM="Strombidium rassoulzadegani, Strain ras09" /LENGTH=294 /DNA_ID=CAMNT_0008651723 /DNA_START=120 /DNA_END=1001 /DNA_ORIENTATION=+
MKTILNLAAVLLLATSANAVKLRALESAAISDCGCDDTCPIECCDDDNLPDHDCTNSGGCGVLPYFCDPTPPHLRESHESYPNQNRCPNRDDLYPTEYPACEVKDKENCCQNDLLDCLADQVSEDTSVIDVLLDLTGDAVEGAQLDPEDPRDHLVQRAPREEPDLQETEAVMAPLDARAISVQSDPPDSQDPEVILERRVSRDLADPPDLPGPRDLKVKLESVDALDHSETRDKTESRAGSATEDVEDSRETAFASAATPVFSEAETTATLAAASAAPLAQYEQKEGSERARNP